MIRFQIARNGNSRHSFRIFAAICGLALLVLFTHATRAQHPLPSIGYVYPAGGQAGTNFQIIIGGQRLDGATNVCVSGGGIEARVIEHVKPITQGQLNNLRDQIKELQEKRQAAARTNRTGAADSKTNGTWTAEDEKTVAEIKKKIAVFINRPPNPAIAETVRVEVNIAPGTQPSTRELRLASASGLSNPLVFCVGQLPEFSEKLIDLSGKDIDLKRLRTNPEQKAASASEMTIRIPATVNGQVMAGGRDRFRFTAKKGQQLVLIASARQLIPYLPDAVPGWFQATLALYDAKGRELAYDDDFRFHPDPVLHFRIPADGHYVVEIRDAIYRGREDFVYRISIGELPFITSIFPLGGRANGQPSIALNGWNLPVQRIQQKTSGPGVVPVSIRTPEFVSNEMPFAVNTLPEAPEQEPNNLLPSAEKITLPVIINGRIAQHGDWDIFQFEAKAGAELVAEVHARRLNSPLDSILKLTDASGRQIASNDDHEDKGAGLTTHHADSLLRATFPASGTYYLHIGDSQQQAGMDYGYRLRISEPRPDFELRVVPSSVTVRGGTSVPLTVYAMRKDGFTGEISLSLKTPGFSIGGARIPAHAEQVRITLAAPAIETNQPITVELRGDARVNGETISHPVVPAEDMMQAFAYRHLVPAKELKVAVSSRYMQRSPAKIVSDSPIKIPAGSNVTVRVAARIGGIRDRVQMKLHEPPEGIVLQKVTMSADGAELILHSDATRVKPGLEGNLIVNLLVGPEKADPKNKKLSPIGFLPAIPFEVVANQ